MCEATAPVVNQFAPGVERTFSEEAKYPPELEDILNFSSGSQMSTAAFPPFTLLQKSNCTERDEDLNGLLKPCLAEDFSLTFRSINPPFLVPITARLIPCTR